MIGPTDKVLPLTIQRPKTLNLMPIEDNDLCFQTPVKIAEEESKDPSNHLIKSGMSDSY